RHVAQIRVAGPDRARGAVHGRDVRGGPTPMTTTAASKRGVTGMTQEQAAKGAVPTWHAMPIDEALRAQGVDVGGGLAAEEVESRRATFGANKFAEAAREPRWKAFLRQYRDPMQIVLL